MGLSGNIEKGDVSQSRFRLRAKQLESLTWLTYAVLTYPRLLDLAHLLRLYHEFTLLFEMG